MTKRTSEADYFLFSDRKLNMSSEADDLVDKPEDVVRVMDSVVWEEKGRLNFLKLALGLLWSTPVISCIVAIYC